MTPTLQDEREQGITIDVAYRAFETPGRRFLVADAPGHESGDNLTWRSDKTPWYTGPTLLGHLETVEFEEPAVDQPFRLPVQYVNRPGPDFRGYCGRVAAGAVSPGDLVRVMPSGVETEVESIVVWQGTRQRAARGDSITLTLAPDVDVTRGDVICDAQAALEVADQFQAKIVWMGDADSLHPATSWRSSWMRRSRCARGVTRRTSTPRR